jgi:hypothetical protein
VTTKSWLGADISARILSFSAIRLKHLSKKTFCLEEVIPPSARRQEPGTHFAFQSNITIFLIFIKRSKRYLNIRPKERGEKNGRQWSQSTKQGRGSSK